MSAQNNFRKLYLPVQPAISHSGEDEVVYFEAPPHLGLQPFIFCYWQLKTVRPLENNFSYRVVADGCIDILLEINRPEESFITGLATGHVEFPLGDSFYYIGVRFLPTGFPQLFNIDASELTNQFFSLNDLLSDTAQYIARRISPEINFQKIKSLLDEHFLSEYSKRKILADDRVFNALEIILKNKGVVNLKDLNTGLSARQMRRLFHFYVGDSIKTFSKVVRFQNILQAKPSIQSLRQDKIYYDMGYYDQAHFVKEFKHFYGATPRQAFQG